MLLLKQNSGVYWNEGAYSVGTLIREGALIGRRALNSNHCGDRLIGQSVNQSISPFVISCWFCFYFLRRLTICTGVLPHSTCLLPNGSSQSWVPLELKSKYQRPTMQQNLCWRVSCIHECFSRRNWRVLRLKVSDRMNEKLYRWRKSDLEKFLICDRKDENMRKRSTMWLW